MTLHARNWIIVSGCPDAGKTTLIEAIKHHSRRLKFVGPPSVRQLKYCISTYQKTPHLKGHSGGESFLGIVQHAPHNLPASYAAVVHEMAQSSGGTSTWGLFDTHFVFPVSSRRYRRIYDPRAFEMLNVQLVLYVHADPATVLLRYSKRVKPHHLLGLRAREIKIIQDREKFYAERLAAVRRVPLFVCDQSSRRCVLRSVRRILAFCEATEKK